METKHTPAPWHIDEHAQIIGGKSVLGRVYCDDIFPNEDLPECEANARLIAAAPETTDDLMACYGYLLNYMPKAHRDTQLGQSFLSFIRGHLADAYGKDGQQIEEEASERKAFGDSVEELNTEMLEALEIIGKSEDKNFWLKAIGEKDYNKIQSVIKKAKGL